MRMELDGMGVGEDNRERGDGGGPARAERGHKGTVFAHKDTAEFQLVALEVIQI